VAGDAAEAGVVELSNGVIVRLDRTIQYAAPFGSIVDGGAYWMPFAGHDDRRKRRAGSNPGLFSCMASAIIHHAVIVRLDRTIQYAARPIGVIGDRSVYWIPCSRGA